jgi:DNA modification methylase
MPLLPYFGHAGITLYHGDCREILPQLQSETFDFVLTDPQRNILCKSPFPLPWPLKVN